MVMEVEIISRENIKPSSPTPFHLRNYKLSLLDQLTPQEYVPMLLFYHAPLNASTRESLQLLKESLSKTLSHFYPFAGKMKDRLSVDCNDEGAYFAEARVAARMTQRFLDQPNLALLQRFLPRESTFIEEDSGCHVSMFQVNVFDCGSIVIAMLVHHKVADGKASSKFLHTWAAIANSGSDQSESLSLLPPSYVSTSLFPQNETLPAEFILKQFLRKGKSVTRRFKFDAASLSALKAKATTNLQNGHNHIPTRVQSVTALIWKSFIATRTCLSGAQKPCFAVHAVDLRTRASPPFSESCMGNFVWVAWAKSKDTDRLDQLVGEINKAIKKIDAEFVKELQGESGTSFKYPKALEGFREEIDKEAADFLAFTSWTNFGLYKVDFGWGKPALVTTSGNDSLPIFLNGVYLLETKEGDGMEAWVTLDEQEMALFECQSELLSYASVDAGDGDY